MSVGLRIVGTSNLNEVDANQGSRIVPYDSGTNQLAPTNRATVTDSVGGTLIAGRDYKTAYSARIGSTGALQVGGDETCLFFDSFEGATRNLMKWVEVATTMTSSQAAATGLTLNTAGTTTTTTGILEFTHIAFPLKARAGLVFRAHLNVQGASNCVEEWGFSDQGSATTTAHQNGAFFRRDSAGSLQPVLAFNNVETQGTVMNVINTTDYFTYEIWLQETRATFQIWNHSGTLVGSQVMEIGSSGGGAGSATQARMFTVTHLWGILRVLNTAAAGTAPKIIVSQASVYEMDTDSQRDYVIQQAGVGLDGITSPNAFTQLANWGNSAAPTTRTLSNTAAAETTLGGLLVVNSIAGGSTDYIMFGWQNPSNYTFYCTAIHIPVPLNQVVAVATTDTIFAYFAAFNSSAVSLATAAPYTPMRIGLGEIHRGAVALAANAPFSGNPIHMVFGNPKAVFPGRFLHVGCRELVGTATATETYLWAGVVVEGFFE